MSDLILIVPELILSGIAVALILVARRIRKTRVSEIATVLAATACALASCWILSWGARTGFGGMITVDGYSQFFKVLIAAALAVAALLSVRSGDAGETPRAEY